MKKISLLFLLSIALFTVVNAQSKKKKPTKNVETKIVDTKLAEVKLKKSKASFRALDGQFYDVFFTKDLTKEINPAKLIGIGYKTEYLIYQNDSIPDPFAMVKIEHIRGKNELGESNLMLVSISQLSNRSGAGWGQYTFYYEDFSKINTVNGLFDIISETDKLKKGVANFTDSKKGHVELKYIVGDNKGKGVGFFFDDKFRD